MENYLLILLLCSVIIIIWYSFRLNKTQNTLEKVIFEKHDLETLKKEELKEYFREEWDRQEKHLQDELIHHEKEVKLKRDKLESDFKVSETELNGILRQLESLLKEKEKRYNEVNQDLETYRKGKINEIDSAGAEYEKRKRLLIDAGVVQYREVRSKLYNEELSAMEAQKNEMLEQIHQIKSELEEERTKRAAINEELRKAEEKEKYNEIHSVQLTDNEKEDIHFLLSLEDRMHNKQVLYKLVWSTYLQQAYKNTFHNILGNRDPKNVIYCIENINTGKKYIGKTSAEVSKRWTEHIKTSLNIGTIKTTNIHKALYNHWDEFIFYIITETEKDKLSEMEKYYIKFYESDKYGYNIKAGG